MHFIRHGTRNPTLSDIQALADLENLVRLEGSDRLPEPLRRWVSPFGPRDDSKLARAGEHEMHRLGVRTAKRYRRALFDGTTEDARDPDLISTMAARTGMSGSAFASGLLEVDVDSGSTWDFELSAKHSCPRWDLERRLDARAGLERAALAVRLAGISQRLQAAYFDNNNNYESGSSSDAWLAETVFTACAFGVAHGDARTAEWCSVLQDGSERQLLEYADDLAHWWAYAYAREFNAYVGCAGLKDVVEGAEAALRATGGERAVRARFGFGHSDTLVFLAVGMGLFKDGSALVGNASTTDMDARRFRMADLAPMGGSIAFELHTCPAGGVHARWQQAPLLPDPQSASTPGFVRVLVNERPVPLGGACAGGEVDVGREFCPLERFKELVGAAACRFADNCGVRDGGGGRP
ncbi:PHOsphatase, partial [Cladochytrium tenue]